MDYERLIELIERAHTTTAGRASATANRMLVLRNWCVGGYLAAFEQEGEDRARYGDKLLATVAKDLRARKVVGLGTTSLKYCRQMHKMYPQIGQQGVDQSMISGLLTRYENDNPKIPQLPVAESPSPLTAELLLRLSWTHFTELIRIDDPWKRAFYENHTIAEN